MDTTGLGIARPGTSAGCKELRAVLDCGGKALRDAALDWFH
jgi:hypothetical protein